MMGISGGGGGAAAPHQIGGAQHLADTIANLNTKVSDATLDDQGATRTPAAHNLGGVEHGADTLANLNLKVSDANLDDTGTARVPTVHEGSHRPAGADPLVQVPGHLHAGVVGDGGQISGVTALTDVLNHAHAGVAGDGAQFNHANLAAVGVDDHHAQAHEATHDRAGADELDGDVIDIDFTPANYTPSVVPPEVTDVDELSAHLKGIDLVLGTGLPASPASYWGGNLVKNYPSMELADAAQPEWWEISGDPTFQENDAVGESVPEKHLRVLKLFVSADGGGVDYGYQRYIHADEPLLDDSITVISAGAWIYSIDTGTVTLELYDVGGAGSLGTATTITEDTWVYLSIEDKTLGTTSTELRLKHSANNASVYMALPMLSVGPSSRLWEPRRIAYVDKPSESYAYDVNPSDDNWHDVDFTALAEPLACLLHLKGKIGVSDTAGLGCARRNGSAAGQAHGNVLVGGDAVGAHHGSKIVQCDDGQIVEISAVTNGNVTQLAVSLQGYFRWE